VISPGLVMALAAAVVLAAGSVPAAEIHDAARSGDSSKVKALVEKDPGLASARNPNGQTPLFDAVMGRHPEIAEYLISKGADVNAVAKYTGRPLDLADESSDTAVVHFTTSGVVCMGDLLLSQSCPAIDNVAGYMELLDKVIDVFPAATRFVSGHGRDLTLEELKRYRDALAEMIGIVKKNHAAGKTADEMIRADILKAYKPDYSQLDWLGPDTWIVSVVRNLQSGSLK